MSTVQADRMEKFRPLTSFPHASLPHNLDQPSVFFLKVAPLAPNVTEDLVRALFASYGEVWMVAIFSLLKNESVEDTVKTEETTDGETAMADGNADDTTTIKEETPATEETKTEPFALVAFKTEDARDSATKFEGELSGKTITAGVFYPRAQRIG
eukprot:296994_1